MRRHSRTWVGRWLLSMAAAVLAVVFAPSAHASEPTQAVVSTGGVWLEGWAGSDADVPGWGVDDDYGGLMRFRINYVDPGLVLAGDEPSSEGAADLREPWISIVEEHATPPEGGGSQGWLRDVHELCSSFVNPSNATTEIDEAAKRIRVSVDVSCDDGRGYDFYRVTWQGDIREYSGSDLPDVGWIWGSTEGDGWQGHIDVAKVRGVKTHLLDVSMRICGHPAAEADDCVVEERARSGRLNAGAIFTTANRDG